MTPFSDMHHGGALDQVKQQFPQAPQPWIDLSTGINPWPWPVPSAILHEPSLLSALPTQRDWEACRAAMATALDVSPEYVLPVPGSAMVIALLPQVIKANHAACLSPSYGDHERSWQAAGVRTSQLPADLNLGANVGAATLSNPNNPDGTVFSTPALLALREKLNERSGHLIVDEAYGELCPDKTLAGHVDGGGLLVLRSFGKFFGLAGVRLGAVIAPPRLLERIAALLGDWPVGTLALKIGAAAYADHAFALRTRTRLAAARARLNKLLHEAEITVSGGTDLFGYIEVTDSHGLWDHLAQAGIYTRRFAWSKRHLRLGLPASTQDEERLSAALKQWQGL